jgi:hypothetical protein
MKSSLFRLPATALLAMLALPAFAGPGPQSWRSPADDAASPAKPESNAAVVCPGSKEVAAFAKLPAWANGKGPLVDPQVGTKRVCTICPVTGIASSGWANARGPVTKSDTTSIGTEHTCTSACRATKS